MGFQIGCGRPDDLVTQATSSSFAGGSGCLFLGFTPPPMCSFSPTSGACLLAAKSNPVPLKLPSNPSAM